MKKAYAITGIVIGIIYHDEDEFEFEFDIELVSDGFRVAYETDGPMYFDNEAEALRKFDCFNPEDSEHERILEDANKIVLELWSGFDKDGEFEGAKIEKEKTFDLRAKKASNETA